MNRSIFLTIFSLFFVCALRCGADELIPPNKENFHLFLLVGQSNMAGRGKIEDQDLVEHPRVLSLSKDLQWKPAVDPLHFDKPAVVGVGLGKTFGLKIIEATPGITVGLIPCAVGGSSIETWQPGGYHESTKSHPWDDMLPRAREAMKVGTLKGILWHQGESDANENRAGSYERLMVILVDRFRKDLSCPAVPFLCGQLGRFEDRPWDSYRQAVDAAHQKLPTLLPNVGFVSSEGLGHSGDKVHFSAAAYRTFGERFAAEYLRQR